MYPCTFDRCVVLLVGTTYTLVWEAAGDARNDAITEVTEVAYVFALGLACCAEFHERLGKAILGHRTVTLGQIQMSDVFVRRTMMASQTVLTLSHHGYRVANAQPLSNVLAASLTYDAPEQCTGCGVSSWTPPTLLLPSSGYLLSSLCSPA